MVIDPKDRINVVLDVETRGLLDALATHLGSKNRSGAIRFAVKETVKALGLKVEEKKKRVSKKGP